MGAVFYTEIMLITLIQNMSGDASYYAPLAGKMLRKGAWARILVQVTIYRRLLIGRDGHLDQSEAYDIS